MLTRVFQLIGSTKLFTTSATTSTLIFARPILVGSRFMQVSHIAHWCAIAGTALFAHKFVL